MARRILTVFVCLLIVLAVSILRVTASGNAETGGPPTLAGNQTAAKADATKLLTEVAIPSGAHKLTAEPAGDNGYLHPLPHLSSTPGSVATAWWSVPGATPDQVIAAVRASPPPGVASTATGGGGNTNTGTSSSGFTFFLKDVPGRLESRTVEVTATALAGGATGVMVQAQSEGVVPRAAASLIPGTAHGITVSETTAHGTVLRSATVTAISRVRRTVAYFNRLEPGQPGTINCPAQMGGLDVLTVAFLPAAGASPVATASFSGDFRQPDSGLSSECSEVELRVGAQTQVGLLGGHYVSSLNRLLGTRLP